MRISISCSKHYHIKMNKSIECSWEEFCQMIAHSYGRAQLVIEKLRVEKELELWSKRNEGRERLGGIKTLGKFFVRGCIEWSDSHVTGSGKEMGEGYWRCDRNLKKTELIVIDIDKCNVKWDDLIEGLEKCDVNYLAYTSYSYDPDEWKYKYRVVFPLDEVCGDKIELERITQGVYSRLMLSKLSGIVWASENVRWSQEWYFGLMGKEENAKCSYECDKENIDISALDMIDINPASCDPDNVSVSTVEGDNSDWSDKFRRIREGDDYHGMLNDFIWGCVSDGVDPSICVGLAQELMGLVRVSERDDRWDNRFSDIERSVNGAVRKISMVEGDDDPILSYKVPDERISKYKHKGGRPSIKSDTNIDKAKSKIPGFTYEGEETDRNGMPVSLVERINKYNPSDWVQWPPGEVGELAQSLYDLMVNKNKFLAIVCAVSAYDAVFGRRYNISGDGLNKYWLVLMGTGTGKSDIRRCISRCLNDVGYGRRIGDSSVTGPKAIANKLGEERCHVMICNEMGLFMRDQSGSPDRTRGYFLEVYGNGGVDGWIGSIGYSKKGEGSIGNMRGVCITVIGEATPVTYLHTIKDIDVDTSGDLARTHVFAMNPEIKKITAEDVNRRICVRLPDSWLRWKTRNPLGENSNDPYRVCNIEIPPDWFDLNYEFKLKSKMFDDVGDHIYHSYYSRAGMKILKLYGTLVCAKYGNAPFNNDKSGKNSSPDSNPAILFDLDESHKELFDWCVTFLEIELKALDMFKSRMISTIDLLETTECSKIIVREIDLLLSRGHSPNVARLTNAMLKYKCVSRHNLESVFKRYSDFTSLKFDNKYKSGIWIDALIEALTGNGLLCKIPPLLLATTGLKNKFSSLYQITEKYVDLANRMGNAEG